MAQYLDNNETPAERRRQPVMLLLMLLAAVLLMFHPGMCLLLSMFDLLLSIQHAVAFL